MDNNEAFIEPEMKAMSKRIKPESALKRFAKGLGFTVAVIGLSLAMVTGLFFGAKAISFSDKNHSYERSEISQIDYAMTTSKTEKTYYVKGEENGIYFCERKNGKTECLNSNHTVKLTHSTTRGNGFYQPQLEILGTDVIYRLVCNRDADGRYCVPAEYTV